MRIKNKRAKTNYVNYKSSGMSKRIAIQAGKTANIPAITNVLQIINFGDFQRGFFEIIEDKLIEKITTKKKSEDSLEKIKKEVKDYIDNKE